ncbi:hypothetical protein [Streptomyces sp. AVP053U2]|uniref:hypothetical protein n=1 Tax=Streptomyces sp. AVP053U2 TaxID=1737066 RepID=UPI00073D066F|nr:hypothetical protein [Streptomyces sp. AVP053U2]ODA69255.1 hypothetical protein APS67_006601 [Streptomyces sp. AVP053U2]
MSEQPPLVTGIPAGLTIRGLDRDQTPTADWLCSCRRHERATGRTAVQQLLARARAGVCPHREEQAVLAPVIPIRRIDREAS